MEFNGKSFIAEESNVGVCIMKYNVFTYPVTVDTPCCIKNLVKNTHLKSCSEKGKTNSILNILLHNNTYLLSFMDTNKRKSKKVAMTVFSHQKTKSTKKYSYLLMAPRIPRKPF